MTSCGSRPDGAAGWPSSSAQPGRQRGARRRPAVVTEDHQLRRLTLHDVPAPVEPLTSMRRAEAVQRQNPKARRDLAATLRAPIPHDPPPTRTPAADGDPADEPSVERAAPADEARTRATAAPTARTMPAGPSGGGGCAARPTASSARSTGARTPSRKTFDRICDLLVEMGYLGRGRGDRHRRWRPAAPALHREGPAGRRVPARTASGGGSTRASLAAVVSAPSCTSRAAKGRRSPRGCPTTTSRGVRPGWSGSGPTRGGRGDRWRCPRTGMPDGGIAWMVHRWASGAAPGGRAARHRHGAGRLRAALQADHRPARPDRRRRGPAAVRRPHAGPVDGGDARGRRGRPPRLRSFSSEDAAAAVRVATMRR